MPEDRDRGDNKFYGAAKDELGRIEAKISEADAIAEKLRIEDSETAGRWQEIADDAREEKDLFMAEHDQAGAFKIEKFDRQVRDFFFANESEKRPQVIERDQEGMYHLAKGQENRRMLFVDMLELARINSPKAGGSHAAGDAALVGTVGAIKEAVEAKYAAKKEGQAPRFDILRVTGNQYMVSFEDISADAFDEISAELSGRVVGEGPAFAGIEGAPLVVSSMNFADVVEDMNVLQTVTGDRFNPGADAGRELMAGLLRGAEWRSDVGKFVKYSERLVEKLGTDTKGAETYFNEYVKKYFDKSPFARLEDIQKIIAGGDVDRAVREGALGAVRAKFDQERKLDATELEHLDEGMRDTIVLERAKARWRGPIEMPPIGEHKPPESEPTVGERVLAEKKETLTLAEAAYQEAFAAEGPQSENVQLLKREFDRAKRRLDTEKARRNVGTGLLGRGVYYKHLETALEAKADITVLSIDMGFLKYFDEDGGKDVGDVGLRTAARLMERSIREAGLDGEAYRIGGDEFGIILKGGKKGAEDFEAKLNELKKERGVIPRGPKSKEAYVPTELQFNMGVADRSDLEDTLKVSGREGASWNKKAEIMTKVADVAVEYYKAIDRIDYLVDQIRQQPSGEVTPDIRAKLDRSAKVVEPRRGGEALIITWAEELRLAAKLPEAEREAIYQKIEDRRTEYVLDGIEAKRLEDRDQKEFMDRFIEAKTKAAFLQKELDNLRDSSRKDKQAVENLQKRLDKTLSELEQMRNVRSSLAT